MQLLGQAGLRRIFANHGDSRAAADEDEAGEEVDTSGFGTRRRRRTKRAKHPYPAVPSEEGTRLMRSGTFGCTEYYQDILKKKNKRLARRLLSRELGAERGQFGTQGQIISQVCFPIQELTLILLTHYRSTIQGLIPSDKADTIIHYNARCYSGQFSDDGNFFFSCAQDFKVRMYDTSNPYSWRYYKTVTYPYGQWTITDATLSPDNKYLAYSSIRSTVCLAPTDPGENGEPWLLDFSDLHSGTGMRRYRPGYSSFGVCCSLCTIGHHC